MLQSDLIEVICARHIVMMSQWLLLLLMPSYAGTSLHSSQWSASKQTVNTFDPTTSATPELVRENATAFVWTYRDQYGASKETRQSRKCLLQCWCAGKVSKQTFLCYLEGTRLTASAGRQASHWKSAHATSMASRPFRASSPHLRSPRQNVGVQ